MLCGLVTVVELHSTVSPPHTKVPRVSGVVCHDTASFTAEELAGGLHGSVQEAAGDDLLQLPVVDLEQRCVDRIAEHRGSYGTADLRPKVLVEVGVLLPVMFSDYARNI